MKFSAFCAFICLANAIPHLNKYRCQTPHVWKGRFSLENIDLTSNIEIRSMQGKIYYDAVKQRFRTITTGKITGSRGETVVLQDMIYLRSQKRLYLLDLNTRRCITYRTDSPWYDIEIPIGAQYVGNHFIGSTAIWGAGLEIQVWSTTVQNPPMVTNYTVTQNGCLPVSINIKGKGLDASNSFYDISLGIKNPDEVFKPPKECAQQEKASREFGLFSRSTKRLSQRLYHLTRQVHVMRKFGFTDSEKI